jgi:serine/threonine protein phosphatase PrpC
VAKQERGGTFITASVRGANHAGKGLPCQDAVTSAVLLHRGQKFYFMAVADGHGGADYTRSETGAFLALQAAGESVNRFIMFVVDVFEQYPATWVEMVKEDFTSRLGKILVSNWIRMVEAHANDAGKEGDFIKRYGTTLSMALIFRGQLFSGRIGDSPAYILDKAKKPEVKALFEEDQDSLGLGTASLCSKEAYRKWQTRFLSLNTVPLLVLATDGFADSLKDPGAVIIDFYKSIVKKGAAEFEGRLNGELLEITEKGVGDDISLALFLT